MRSSEIEIFRAGRAGAHIAQHAGRLDVPALGLGIVEVRLRLGGLNLLGGGFGSL